MDIIVKAKRRIKQERVNLYSKRANQFFANAPYDFQLYTKYVNRLSHSKQYNIISFDEDITTKASNFIIRHDIDTVDCLANSHFLIDFHINSKVPVSVFVRVDGMDYPKTDSYKYMQNYLGKIDIGLHSSCYINDDPYKSLRKEITLFNQLYGFDPEYITLHGLGEFKYQERLKFIEQMQNRYFEFGFSFADFLPSLRRYDYVVQDCSLNNKQRYLKRDILRLPPPIKGSCYLLLAHPCYWKV